MTSAIDLAEEALALNNHLKDNEHPLMANLQGRPVAHWSYKVEIVGIIVGVVAIVAFSILKMIPAAIVGGALVLTDLFAAYFLHKFRLYNQLEDYVKDMADRIHSFSDRVDELKEVNTGLEHIGKDMEDVPKDWKEQMEKGNKELQKVQKKIDVLKTDYDSVLNKLSKFSDISKMMEQVAGSMAQDTINFGGENKLKEEFLKKIAYERMSFEAKNENIQENNKELNKENQELERLEKEFNHSLKMFKEISDTLKDLNTQLPDTVVLARKKIGEINATVPDIDVNQLIKQMKDLEAKVENKAEIKAELKELREFINSRKDEFEEWKKLNGRTINL
jgi:chromosome segregation ATPase